MLASSFVLLVIPLVFAQIKPLTPGPNETYAAGSACNVSWTPDASASWTNMTIDLMSGSNSNMSLVTVVASGLDGTNASLTPFSWTCPEVTPYSAIYFYQFTNGNDTANSTWTTRFTISSPSGDTEPPSASAQPNGDAVPWGTGQLAAKEADQSGSLPSASGSATTGGKDASSAAPSTTRTPGSRQASKESGTKSALETAALSTGSSSESSSKRRTDHHRATRTSEHKDKESGSAHDDKESNSAHEHKKHTETASPPDDMHTASAPHSKSQSGKEAEATGTLKMNSRPSAAQKDSPSFASSESGSPDDCHCFSEASTSSAIALDHRHPASSLVLPALFSTLVCGLMTML